jgi:hypothetical protein
LAKNRGWVADQHFSVDATLIEAWASLQSFKPKKHDRGDGKGWADFKGEKRRNDTHESTTDPEAKLVRKGDGREAKLAFAGHAAMENRHGRCVLFEVKPAAGSDAEVAVQQIAELQQRDITPRIVGGDRGYCSRNFIEGLRSHGVVPHPAPMKDRRLLGVKVRSKAHQLSQKCRRKIEEIFGWAKTTGCFQEPLSRGRAHACGGAVCRRRLQSRSDGTSGGRTAKSGRGIMPAGAVVSADTTKTPPQHSARARAGAPAAAPISENPFRILALIQESRRTRKMRVLQQPVSVLSGKFVA